MKIFGKEIKLNSATVLEAWHYIGLGTTAVGMVATQIAPLVDSSPKASAIVGSIGAASLTITSIMQRIANNKIVKSIINDPSSPTPQGFGIPKPDALKPEESTVHSAVMDASVPSAAAVAIAQNVAAFKAVIAEQKK